MAENQLAVIVKESGLAPAKAKVILEQFSNYFDIAADWEQKARVIKVTNETQTVDMELARVGRLALKEMRVNVENRRKELKAEAVREGKAIDGIANVLKAVIVPIEEYLEKQEKFVEFKKKAEEDAKRLEIEKRMAKEEEERIVKEKAENERLRQENIKLAKEAEAREKKMFAERKKQEVLLAKERAEAEAKQEAIEEKARKERQAQEKKMAEERAIAEVEKKKAEEKARKEKEAQQKKIEAERKEKERLAELLKNQIECPKCGHKFQLKK